MSTLQRVLIPVILRKALVQALFSAYNDVHFLTHHLPHFPTLYPLSYISLPEGRAGTA
jgi:hypothetical protein